MGGVSGDDCDGIPSSRYLAVSDRLRGAGLGGLLGLAGGLCSPAPEDGGEDDGTEDADDRKSEAGGHFAHSSDLAVTSFSLRIQPLPNVAKLGSDRKNLSRRAEMRVTNSAGGRAIARARVTGPI